MPVFRVDSSRRAIKVKDSMEEKKSPEVNNSSVLHNDSGPKSAADILENKIWNISDHNSLLHCLNSRLSAIHRLSAHQKVIVLYYHQLIKKYS